MTPGWDGLEAQRVVDHSGDPDLFAAGDVLGDVGLKGVYPPSCETTSLLLTHTVARWVADSKWSTMRRPCQPRGTQTLVLPDIAEVIAHRRVGRDVVETAEPPSRGAAGSGPANHCLDRPWPA
jgi:hypothetical protein